MKHFRKHPDLLIIANREHTTLAHAIARESKKEKVFITHDITSMRDLPYFLQLVLYHHQTEAFCILQYAKTNSQVVIACMVMVLRVLGKRTVVLFPRRIKNRAKRTQFTRRVASKLFPSPVHNLGLAYMLKKGAY